MDLITGKGPDQALEGAEVVINLANSPTFDEASLGFFRASMSNLLAAAERAGVRHQVILSIVGVEQVPQLDYYRAKTLQEDLLSQGPTPYSMVRATQFFELMDAVVSWTSDDNTVRLPATLQPIAAADVVDAVVEVSADGNVGHGERPRQSQASTARYAGSGGSARPCSIVPPPWVSACQPPPAQASRSSQDQHSIPAAGPSI